MTNEGPLWCYQLLTWERARKVSLCCRGGAAPNFTQRRLLWLNGAFMLSFSESLFLAHPFSDVSRAPRSVLITVASPVGGLIRCRPVVPLALLSVLMWVVVDIR